MKPFEFTQQGLSHINAGVPNQDALATCEFMGYTLAVMADGMGSASLAREAAHICVERAMNVLLMTLLPCETSYETDLNATVPIAVRAAFACAHNSLHQAALNNNWSINELKCTLMCAVLHNASGRLWWGSCGDGGIIIKRASETRVVTNPQKGEQFNQTNEVLQRLWSFGCVGDVSGFIMATDGLFDYMTSIDRHEYLSCTPIVDRIFHLHALGESTVDPEKGEGIQASFPLYEPLPAPCCSLRERFGKRRRTRFHVRKRRALDPRLAVVAALPVTVPAAVPPAAVPSAVDDTALTHVMARAEIPRATAAETTKAAAPTNGYDQLKALFSAVTYSDYAEDGNPFGFVTDDRSVIVHTRSEEPSCR